MGVAFSNTCSVPGNGVGALSLATSPSLAGNLIAIIGIVTRTSVGESKVLYGGQSATFIGSAVTGTGPRLGLWSFPNPPNSPCTIQACFTTTNIDGVLGVSFYQGVLTQTPISASVLATSSSGTTKTTSVAGTVGRALVDFFTCGTLSSSASLNNALTASAPQTKRFELESGGATETRLASSDDVSPSDQVTGWTISEGSANVHGVLQLNSTNTAKKVTWFFFRVLNHRLRLWLMDWKVWWKWHLWHRSGIGDSRGLAF